MKSFFMWSKYVDIETNRYITLILLAIVENICTISAPLSFAKIITCATINAYSQTTIWILITFFVTIFSHIIKNYVYSTLNNSKKFLLKNELLRGNTETNASQIACGIMVFYDYFKLLIFLFSIIIVAIFLNFKFSIMLLSSILICSFIYLLSKAQFNNIIKFVWPFIIVIQLIILNNALKQQDITLSVFLVISTFINNHLLKPTEIPNHINYLKNLEQLINECKNNSTLNKKQNSTHTKKK